MMKRIYYALIFILFTCFAEGQYFAGEFNCSTIIVGKSASATGHVLIGHNEDDGGIQVVNFYKIPKDEDPGGDVILKNGAALDQVSTTLGYVWFEMPGQDFADSFLNEKGVLITSNSCPSIERQGELVDGGIGYNLRKLVAERAESARHGVEVAGELISKVGYDASGRTYTIADTKEAWMLSVIRGKHWAAMRIPDNHVVYLPNYYIIREIDFEDPENFITSPGLKEYAIRRQWYNPENGEFIFSKVYGSARSSESMSNIGRMWTGVNLLSSRKYDITDEMPESFIPAKPVTIEDLMNILGNHYEGTHLDDSEHYTLHNPHENQVMNICARHQQLSFVAELRDDMPVEIGCRLWIAPRRGCVHTYMPVYYGINDFPEDYRYYDNTDSVASKHFQPPDNMYNMNNGKAWWSFMEVTEYIDDDYEGRIEERRRIKNHLQQEYFIMTEEFENEIIKLWERDKAAALKDITEFNYRVFNKAIDTNTDYLKK